MARGACANDVGHELAVVDFEYQMLCFPTAINEGCTDHNLAIVLLKYARKSYTTMNREDDVLVSLLPEQSVSIRRESGEKFQVRHRRDFPSIALAHELE